MKLNVKHEQKSELLCVLQSVSEYYDVTTERLKSYERTLEAAVPRRQFAFICSEYEKASISEIGEILGGRDHSTVHSMINRTRRAVESGADTETEQIREILANAAVLKKKLCYICPECGTRWVHGYFNGREFLPDSEISIYRCLFERI